MSLYEILQQSSAHRQSRDNVKKYVLETNQMDALVTYAFNIQDPIHIKACWVWELIVVDDTKLILPYIEQYCTQVKSVVAESAVRSMAKIALYITHSKAIKLNTLQQEHIAEMCFDWLINPRKVACKAYAMQALVPLGKSMDWIFPTLIPILQQEYSVQSPAYQACTRNTLKAIEKLKKTEKMLKK